jgi:UDP-sugar transporter A1/2/3
MDSSTSKNDPVNGEELELTEKTNGNGSEVEALLIPSGNEEGSTKKRATKNKEGPAPPGGRPVKRRVRKNNKPPGQQQDTATFIKYAALFLLVAQMVGLVLLMRYSRTVKTSTDEPLYLASTAVFIMEVMKLVICFFVIAYQSGGDFLTDLNKHILQSPMEIVKLCVPSLLYTVQNNLLYLALTNLDAATYQVCYQLKILTTALFSAVLLQRKFSARKWASLVILTVGVAIVQVSGSGDQHSAGQESDTDKQHKLIGLIAVVCAACTSGFSGVYFEKILKGSRTSLWIRNVQMGLPSVIIAYITIYVKDAPAVQKQGMLGGFSNIVWTVVTVQAVGGLIVATVVKYADNVLKVFATSFSIVISCIISAFLFDFHPTLSFLFGASLVVTATVMYSSPERKPRRKSILPTTGKVRN